MTRAIHGAPAEALRRALEALAELSFWISWTADPDPGLRPRPHVSARRMRDTATELRKAARLLDEAAERAEEAYRRVRPAAPAPGARGRPSTTVRAPCREEPGRPRAIGARGPESEPSLAMETTGMTCSNTDTATPGSTRHETVRPYARSANGESASAIAVAPTRRQPSRSPYRIPRPAVISFSGGRTSGYMLKRIVDAFGGALPSDIAVVFANTGRERRETLDFVDICGREFGVEIAWVEYCWDAPHRTRLVDHATASRNGEPYAALIERKGFVPNPTLRACTTFLKRDRIEAYARHRLGLRRWHAVIGLRADEPRRVHRMRARNCGSRTGAHAVLPLADAGVREADVLAWWKRQPFDLGLGSYQGNCDLCFLKGRAKLIRIIRDDPSRADWWIEREASVAQRTGPDGRHCDSLKRFRLEETYAELRTAALAHRDLFNDLSAGTPADEADLGDCLCTD